MYGSGTHMMLVKHQCVSFRKKRGAQKGIDSLPPPLYDCYPIPIKKAKADDLRSLVSRYVPTAYQAFYSELPTTDDDDSDSDTDSSGGHSLISCFSTDYNFSEHKTQTRFVHVILCVLFLP